MMSRGVDHITDGGYPSTACFLAGRLRDNLAQDDLSCIEDMVTGERVLADREVLVERGDTVDSGAILISGMMLRTITEGEQRYIVGLQVPGDFVDLHGYALKRLDHSIVAAGTAQVGIVPHTRIDQAVRERPNLTRALWFATMLDAAIHRKWIQMLERLDAPRRIAHIYCELQTRLEMVGAGSQRAVRAPFTQLDLADMCGVSAVHANRAVSKLRETGLAQIRRGTLYTSDWPALRRYANFEPGYLYGTDPLKLNEMWD